jgi:hypothetical protein
MNKTEIKASCVSRLLLKMAGTQNCKILRG